MIAYLLKSILCLGIFLVVYHLFLEKEKMHRFNRWYLLGSILFSFVVPFVHFTVTPESLPILQNNYFAILDEPLTIASQESATARVASVSQVDYFELLVLVIYSIITLVCLTRFTRNLYHVLAGASKNKNIRYRGANIVLLKEKTASFSFLHYIFINEQDYANSEIEEEIITHELTHVQQKHSWDVIFIELLQAICWFNPLFIFYKKAIQLNHEYLADEAVIRTYADVPAYQFLLLDKASCECNTHLTSNFNYSVTKKRLIMMTKKYNKATALLKKITLIPVLACTLVFFSAKEMLAQDKKQETKPEKTAVQKNGGEWVAAVPTQLWPDPPHPAGPGASQEELVEFDAIIDKNMTVSKNGHKTLPHVSDAERARLLAIYKHMTTTQRDEARATFRKKRTPIAPKHPTQAQLDKWKDADLYGVWIGSRKINNEELNKYKPEDFGAFDVSNLNYTEKMKENVMKTFNLKKMYKYQLNLYTTADAERDYKKELNGPKENLMFRIKSDGNKKVWMMVN